MKFLTLIAGPLLTVFSFLQTVSAQNFGPFASAVWMTTCEQSNFFNTSNTRTPADAIGPAANNFNNTHFGIHTQNSGTLIFRGGEVKTFKTASGNVCRVNLLYRIYPQSGTPGTFTSLELPFFEDCDVSGSQFPSGGPCGAGDQKWQRVIPNNATNPAPINLTALSPGNYVLELYYEVIGSNSSPSGCSEVITLNNGGANYKAFFTIQNPVINSTNPVTCNGTEGSITVNGLAPNTTYTFTYFDDGVQVGPQSVTTNASGQIVLSGLNAGVYSGFILQINGCTTALATAVTLTNPLFTPLFLPIAPFCAGAPPPALPTTSLNGITGTWSPATINNTSSGTYTFTPTPGQCAQTITINVTVNPNITPTFSFGTSLSICEGGSVPTLPTTSQNGITGTWSPATVSNSASGTYTFTPSGGQCANPTTLTVTVNPIITPTFSFGTSLSICEGGSVPTLPTTSQNGITGTWSPATVSNTASGTYTFTPDAGQCATTTTFTVTVNPNITPTFSFGTSLTICSGGTVPTLPTTSQNGITGTWSPATVSNSASGTYTFTPDAGQCATTTTFTVTVNPNVTPTFAFGTSLTICSGGTVPTLPTTSQNGITGTWSPATVSNSASGTYTFTPDAGQCATTTTFTVTVTPNVTPTFSFGTSLTICSGGTVPTLPTTSQNGITGTWSPAVVSNTASGTYTFTPASGGPCAVPVTFTVTVNPILTPTFSFGTSLSLCSGAPAPVLPTTSQNGVTGTWSPAVVSNTASGTYTFTPNSGQCANTATLTVTINPTPSMSPVANRVVLDGDAVPVTVFTGTPAGVTFSWTNNNPSIGLSASGTGNLPAFTAINRGNADVVATITVTPVLNGCSGAPVTFTITVRPLNKDVFVPNVFSPNGDGKNDRLQVYGNYITRLEMRIFNQWGEQVAFINNVNQGWDGTHRGKPQPVGVYTYALRAELSDGRTVNLKGSITLVR